MDIKFNDFKVASSYVYGRTALQGGSSMMTKDGKTWREPQRGFGVGGITSEGSVEIANPQSFKRKYEEFRESALVELQNNSKSVCLGTWVEDGNIVFDLCNILPSMKDALVLASKRGERAIYDLESQKEIYVNHG